MKQSRGPARIAVWTVRDGLLAAAVFAASGCTPFLESPDATLRETPPNVATILDEQPSNAMSEFGWELAMDERSLVVAAPFEEVFRDSIARPGAGAVYVYDRADLTSAPRRLTLPNADDWDGAQRGDKVPADVPKAILWGGLRLAMNDEWIAVGVPSEDSGDRLNPADNSVEDAGAVYVYDRSDLDRDDPVYLKSAQPAPFAFYGHSVALSGSFLAVGAPGEAGEGPGEDNLSVGGVYLYRRTPEGPEGFELDSYVRSPDGHTGDLFGFDIAMDDQVLAVSATAEEPSNNLRGTGAVHVFERADADWVRASVLIPQVPSSHEGFGSSLALLEGTLAIGSPGGEHCPDANTFGKTGAVHLASKRRGEWAIDACLNPLSGEYSSLFGWDVALSNDRLAVGAPYDKSSLAEDPTDDSLQLAGAVYTYERGRDGLFGPPRYLKPHDPTEWAVFGADVALDDRMLAVGVPGDAIRIPPSGGWPYPSAGLEDEVTPPLIPGSVHLYDDDGK
jgi:hypothetical protein